MIYHQSNAFLQDLSNYFHRWLNLSIRHPGVSQQFMVVFRVEILGCWRPKKSFSSISCSILFKIRDSILLPSSHNCFRLWEFFSPFRSNSRFFSVCLSGANHLRFINSRFQLSFSILTVVRSRVFFLHVSYLCIRAFQILPVDRWRLSQVCAISILIFLRG